MELLTEYSLLFVVALPVAIIVVINLVLAMTGESGTLLLPSLRGYPSVEIPRIEETSEAATPEEIVAAVSPDEYRKAA